MTDDKIKLIYSMFNSIGREVLHEQKATVRGDIKWKYDSTDSYINLVNCKAPVCVIYDLRHTKQARKKSKLYLKSYGN